MPPPPHREQGEVQVTRVQQRWAGSKPGDNPAPRLGARLSVLPPPRAEPADTTHPPPELHTEPPHKSPKDMGCATIA